MLHFFETRLNSYPSELPSRPPARLGAFVWHCTQGSRGWIATLAVSAVALAIYEALLFAIMGRALDVLAAAQSVQQLWAEHRADILGVGVLLAASIALVGFHTLVQHQVLAINFPMRLRWLFHRLMLEQTMSFYADEFAGRVTSKVMQTALAVREFIFTTVNVLINIGVYFVSILVVAASFEPWLLIPFGLWMAAYMAACVYFVPRFVDVGARQADARASMTGRITDAYANIATVKLFAHTRREADYARAAMDAFKVTGFEQMRLVSAFEVINHALTTALIASCAGFGLWLWSENLASAGVVAASLAMALRIAGYSHWVMWELTRLFDEVGTIEDGMATLSKPCTINDAPGAQPLQVRQAAISFEDVRFAYPDARGAVIDGVTLHVRPGERIGLVGRSGAGKSTLVNLLLRFHEVQGGRITIDGQDIREVSQDSLRGAIGMVTQDTALLHRTMGENILYGRPDASDAQMHAAAERAQAAQFIEGLSDREGRSGYAVQVGERGVKLSGGQRQRVAIARVMLKDAPILLLDEATSALDSEVEAAIQESLDGLMHGKTVIAIAHRLSTIAAMDRLVVMDRGRIVEMGTHEQLLATGGIYARLWARQSGAMLGQDE